MAPSDFEDTFLNNYAGTIEVQQNGKEHCLIHYGRTKYYGSAGYGPRFEGFSHSLLISEPGWYSFKPEMFCIRKRGFGFGVKHRYIVK